MIKISKYHKNQHKQIYNSTIEFIDFIKKNVSLKNKTILDIGCGAGANTIYLAKKYPSSNIIGVDYNKSLIKYASSQLKKKKIGNCKFFSSSIESLSLKIINEKKIDIVLSFHFLSFTDEWITENLKKIISLKPKYLAHSSLFYDGEVDAKILIDDFSKSEFKGSYYNIFSIPKIKNFLKKKNFKKFKFEPMKVTKFLKKPIHTGMNSYTIDLKNKKRLLFSGPLFLPHGFFFSKYHL